MQKSKKKLFFKIFAVILAVIIVFAGSFVGYVLYRFNCDKSNAQNSYEQVYNAEQVNLQTDENGIFRILKINDTHMLNGTCENDVKTLEGIKSVLENIHCDFLVADGDIVEGFNLSPSYDKYQALDLLATLIEEYDIMWTFAPGNNDFEIDGSNEDIIAFLMQYEHFVYGNEEGIDGSMQFLQIFITAIIWYIVLQLLTQAQESPKQSAVTSLLPKIRHSGFATGQMKEK